MTKTCWLWTLLLLTLGVATRWIPHPPNFSPLMAIALFGAMVLPTPVALVVPVASMFLGDLFLGFHDLMWVVYLSFLPMVAMGWHLPKLGSAKTWLSWGVAGFLASTLFFLTTNLAVWWSSGMYPHTSAGLTSCFVLALPFWHNSLLSTWLYLAGLEAARRVQLAAATPAVTTN